MAAERTAVAKLAVDSKRSVPSIVALFTGRVSSEIEPVGEEISQEGSLQGDRTSRGDINPEGFEVLRHLGPRQSEVKSTQRGLT